MFKRTFDLLVAANAIIVLAPVMLVVAILIKVDSRGPALYRPYRVGQHGHQFRLYKFRTMVRNAHKQGPLITARGDPRVTRIGRSLRQSKLDELPQLLNVVKGDMSLVGPRPEDPTYTAFYTTEQRQILDFRPGITSPASVAYRDEETILHSHSLSSAYLQNVLPAKLAIDLPYFEHETFVSDLSVIARTLAPVLRGTSLPVRRITTFVRTRIPWILVDAPIAAAGFYAALLLRFLDNTPQDQMRYIGELNLALVPVMVVYAGVNHVWRLHHRLWRYASAPEVVVILSACATSTVIAGLVDLVVGDVYERPLPLSVVVLGGFFTFTGMVLARYRWRLFSSSRRRKELPRRTRALIYGAGDSGQLLARRLLTEPAGAEHELVGFIDDDPAKQGLRIHNIPVVGTGGDVHRLVEEKGADLIILAISHIGGEQFRAIISKTQSTTAQIRVVPDSLESIATSRPVPLVREVRVNDLLGRQNVTIDVEECSRALNDKIVLVTGGAGSVGSELCRQVVSFGPRRLLVLDNNESALHDLEIELRALCPGLDMTSHVGDVTAEAKMDKLFNEMRPQVIFHAAAYKHVPLMERYPEEAIRVNIGGTMRALNKARLYRAERFVLVSTDKAVNAESVMGATKRLAELLVLEAQRRSNQEKWTEHSEGLLCTAVRFGNVLGSRGSVVPTFAKQIAIGGPVTVTHPEMTRYFMEISEAATLIIQAAAMTEGGEIFMLDMGERIRVDDLARKMIRLRGLRPGTDIPITYVGMRPGEKLHEELTFPQEERAQTTHPLIYRISSPSSDDQSEVGNAVSGLLTMATAGRSDQLVKDLMKLSRAVVTETVAVRDAGLGNPAIAPPSWGRLRGEDEGSGPLPEPSSSTART